MNAFAHTVAQLAAIRQNLGGRPFISTPAERAEILRLAGRPDAQP